MRQHPAHLRIGRVLWPKTVPIGRKKSDARKVTNATFQPDQQDNGAAEKNARRLCELVKFCGPKTVPIGRKKSDTRKVTNATFQPGQQVSGAAKKNQSRKNNAPQS
jgi:hypothetical protein